VEVSQAAFSNKRAAWPLDALGIIRAGFSRHLLSERKEKPVKKSADSDRSHEADLSENRSAHSQSTTDVQRLLSSYEEYLSRLLGLADETRRRYLPFAERFLKWQFAVETLDWNRLDGDSVASFVRREGARLNNNGHRAPLTAIRSLLRFLVFEGLIAPGLENAVPRWRRYRHASLPVHLSDHQVTLTLNTCSGDTPIGLRDRAILLLLSRLAVRAKEVISLRLEDIDWVEGTLTIRSKKSLRERSLPLTQDVGEALAKYLREGRPVSPSRFVFLQHNSPHQPFVTSGAISYIAKQAFTRAGIKLPRMGAHAFRHTAATRMICRGASFKEIADILGHKSIDTTGIYAKLDMAGLASVVLPWPGGAK
jgi:integrase/recombinase XerD